MLGQYDFQETIRVCLSTPRKNCSRRVISADQRNQLANPQTAFLHHDLKCRPFAVETLHRLDGVGPTGVPQQSVHVLFHGVSQMRTHFLSKE